MASGTIPQTWNDSGTDYCKMPDGTLIQWGSASIERKVGINETPFITFSIPFTISPMVFTNFQTRAYAPYLSTNVSDVYAEKFKIILVNSDTYDYNNGAVTWLAVGRWK